MKRDLESIIRQNKDAFEAEQLPDGYLTDFERRLNRPKRHLIYSIASLVTIAATITLVLMLKTPAIPTFPDNDFCTEVAELQIYYDNQHKQTIAIINKLLETSPPEVKAEITAQLAQMEVDNMEFQKGLQIELNHEQYLARAVSYNNIRQESLNNIQQILTK